MKYLAIPTENPGEIFALCISKIRNPDLKAKLNALINLIEEAATDLERRIREGSVHAIRQEKIVNENVTAEELVDVYTKRMVPKGTPGRNFYDKIFISAPLNICPLCSLREVTSVEHYLPKAKFPRLSVVPINLHPSCFECNKIKHSTLPTNSSEVTLHPYYDNIENDSWLVANISHTTPPTFTFKVNSPDNWDELLNDRVRFHFGVLGLDKLYSTHAAVELTQINRRLITLYDAFGPNGVRDYLLEGADSRAHANINSWQAAMYNAMATDLWFCNEGFRLS